MCHQLKILIELRQRRCCRYYCGPAMLTLTFHLNIVRLLLFHANEALDFHSEINEKRNELELISTMYELFNLVEMNAFQRKKSSLLSIFIRIPINQSICNDGKRKHAVLWW